MKDRLCKRGKTWLSALCLLAACGLTYSCADDYDLDETTPNWLGASIYDELKTRGNYNYYLKLIDDLGQTEVLSKTGSRTLFVADDDAFERFFRENATRADNDPWKAVTSYDRMSEAQKKLVLNASTITNAYLLELMSNTPGSGDASDPTSLVTKGACLRRETLLSEVDSIPFFYGTQLPTSANPTDKDYWAGYRSTGITLALDNTAPMMTHFLAAQMSNHGITDADFSVLTGKTRTSNDAYIYGSKVTEQDITCQNGYIDVLDNVFVTPNNMAEVLRTNGRTNIFSHMIDRFSLPVYDGSLTNSYQLNGHTNVDSVFVKRYFAARTQSTSGAGGSVYNTDRYGNTVSSYLSFDPGWNQYVASNTATTADMGVILAPTDEVLTSYFLTGGGKFLIDAYGDMANTQENLLHNVDQIPMSVIQALLNNLMKSSLLSTVPSKFGLVMDDANDPMGLTTSDMDTTLLANNGAIYMMNKVFTPAQYAAVSAPPYVGKNMHIFDWAIQNGSTGKTSPNFDLNYYAYLLAMSSRFSLFVPTDEAMKKYIDPLSFGTGYTQPRVYEFTFDGTKSYGSQIICKALPYDPVTGEAGTTYITSGTGVSSSGVQAAIWQNRLKDMLEAHTIIHEGTETSTGLMSGHHWFLAKNGAPIYVENPSNTSTGWKVRGGWQIERPLHADDCNVSEIYDKTKETNGNGNGMTYAIDKPIEASVKTVYGVMYQDGSESSPYKEFLDLCSDAEMDSALIEAGITNATEKSKYAIFVNKVGSTNYYSMDYLVRFFNSYNYTVYVPTNAAITAERAKGLPTWGEVRDSIAKWRDVEADPNYEVRGQAMVTALVNFLKYHFQDRSVFDDTRALPATNYETACMDTTILKYFPVTVEAGGLNDLHVTDKVGQRRNVVSPKNVVARDMRVNASLTASSGTGTTITTSSYVVVHQIDGALNYISLPGGTYAGLWKDGAAAKKYLSKFRIRK